MANEMKRLSSDFFKVFNIDAREASRGLVTGDVEKDELRIAMLLATINAANSLVDVREVVGRVLDMTITLTSADRGILLIKEADGSLSVEMARSCYGKPLPRDDPFSRSIPEQVLQTGKSYWIVDTLSEDKTATAKSVQDLQLRTIMCAPLKIRDEITGVIYLDSKLANREFRNADLAVFEALCLQLAVTLENAWINEVAVRAERDAAIGSITKILMDQLAAPLLEVESHAIDLQEDDSLLEDHRARAGRIRDLASQALTLLDNIAGSSADGDGKGGEHPREEVSIASLVQAALERYRTEIEVRRIHVSFDPQSEGQIPMDSERMGRVVFGLVRGSMDAMPGGGELHITIQELEDGWVELAMVDTRSADAGRAPSDPALEPFMAMGAKSTGPRGGGGDLDLAVARQIVENHGGSLSVDTSEPGRARLTIRLRP